MRILNKWTKYLTIYAVLAFSTPYALATNPSEVQTKNKLKQIDAQINSLQKNLSTEQNKREALHQKLSTTEKQIGEGIHTLRTMQNNMRIKEQKMASLQAKEKQLNQDLIMQQQQLAEHVRARYLMGEYQPLKWLINQDHPQNYSRILSYYLYLIDSRQHVIEEIKQTRISLNENQENMRKELAETKQLQVQVAQHQQQLIKNKSYHTTLIQSINDDIQSKQHDLEEFKKNKRNLSHLLRALAESSAKASAKSSVVQASKSFAQMRRKLPLPVQTAQKSLKRMNQGVTFFADEGTEVSAVYPGKVVFSDWLKGYGLLLIIDHGQGFMTLYAHNQSLFKHKGQYVQQGEHIASVGHTGGIRQNGLYFEVRVKGKAISPFEWLS